MNASCLLDQTGHALILPVSFLSKSTWQPLLPCHLQLEFEIRRTQGLKCLTMKKFIFTLVVLLVLRLQRRIDSAASLNSSYDRICFAISKI